MHINKDDIHPELRTRGEAIRFIIPSFTKNKITFINKVMKKMVGQYSGKYQYENKMIKKQDGSLLRICVYSNPEKKTGKNAGLLWLHGGGYAIGKPEQDNALIDDFLDYGTSVVVSPDYRLSPESEYPGALEDSYAALLWLKQNGHRYGMNDEQIFIGGQSAGGGLAAGTALYARDKGEVNIACQIPLYPMLDDRMITQSSQNNDAPVWNTASNILAWKMYLGDSYQTEDVAPYAAPSRAKDISNLPPFISFIGDIEPFYGETEIYVNRLKRAGIEVHYRVFEKCYHGFDSFAINTNVAQEARRFLKESYIFAMDHYYAPQDK